MTEEMKKEETVNETAETAEDTVKQDETVQEPEVEPNTAMTSPTITYTTATFQPNMLIRRIREPRSTIGDEIRNENVTPNGSPALVKPMNNGIDEQEQNGVTVPSKAAMQFAPMP